MSVYQRGEIWWVKFQFNGQQVRQSAGTTKKKEAQAYERDLRRRLEEDSKALQFGKSLNRTVEAAIEKWIESGAPKSMYSHIRAVREYIGREQLTRAVAASNDMKAAMLAERLSPQTVNRRLAVVRRLLNLAYKQWEWIREPLGQRIELLSEKGFARDVYLTRDEMTKFIDAMKNDEAKRFVLLAAYTGMRKSEIRKLRAHMWREPNILLPSKTKSGRPRAIPLVPELYWVMEDLPFTISEWDLRVDWEQARDAVEMPHVRLHDLRHTFASWIAEDPDTPLTVLRDILGHSSLAVTSRYSHLRTGHAQSAILRLSGHKSGHTTNPKQKTKPKVSR